MRLTGWDVPSYYLLLLLLLAPVFLQILHWACLAFLLHLSQLIFILCLQFQHPVWKGASGNNFIGSICLTFLHSVFPNSSHIQSFNIFLISLNYIGSICSLPCISKQLPHSTHSTSLLNVYFQTTPTHTQSGKMQVEKIGLSDAVHWAAFLDQYPFYTIPINIFS